MASEAEDDSEAAVEEPPALSDSGLEESATEFEFSRPSPPTVTVEDTDHDDGLEVGEADQSGGQETGLDEGVHESDETFDDTLGVFHLYDYSYFFFNSLFWKKSEGTHLLLLKIL